LWCKFTIKCQAQIGTESEFGKKVRFQTQRKIIKLLGDFCYSNVSNVLWLDFRVLSLEARIIEQKKELFTLRDQSQTLRVELDAAKRAFQYSDCPISELIDVVWKKEKELFKLNIELQSHQQTVAGLNKNISRKDELINELMITKNSIPFGPKSVTTYFRKNLPESPSQSPFSDLCFNTRMCSSSTNVACPPTKSSPPSPTSDAQLSSADSSKILHVKKPLVFSKLKQNISPM
jgi:hypothetical protein